MITINNELKTIKIVASGSSLADELESLKRDYSGFSIEIVKFTIKSGELCQNIIRCEKVILCECNIADKNIQKVFNCSTFVIDDCIIETDLEILDLQLLNIRFNTFIDHRIHLSGKINEVIFESNDIKGPIDLGECVVRKARIKQNNLQGSNHVQELTVSVIIFNKMDFNDFPNLTHLSILEDADSITSLPCNIRGSIVMPREVWIKLIELTNKYEQEIVCDTFNSRKNVVDEYGKYLIFYDNTVGRKSLKLMEEDLDKVQASIEHLSSLARDVNNLLNRMTISLDNVRKQTGF